MMGGRGGRRVQIERRTGVVRWRVDAVLVRIVASAEFDGSFDVGRL